jgi:hypothetical protein
MKIAALLWLVPAGAAGHVLALKTKRQWGVRQGVYECCMYSAGYAVNTMFLSSIDGRTHADIAVKHKREVR